MLKLFAYRVVPLALRPLAILLEGMLPGKPTILILSLPIAMIALMLSSIPVHLEYYKDRGGEDEKSKFVRQYRSGLGWLFVFSLIALVGILATPLFDLTIIFIGIVCFTFLVEKLSDESSRALEFRKNYFGWLLVQVLRSSWVLVPLAIGYFWGGYESAYLFVAAVAVLLSILVFVRVTGLLPGLGWEGLVAIRNNIVYFFGSFLPASYRQLPRIVIAKAFPEQAHAFLALAQLGQSVGIIFNVRFQIPYRKIIARKPSLFQSRMAPAMNKIIVCCLVVVVVYAAGPIFHEMVRINEIYQMLFFLPVVVADSLLFSVLSAYLGYVQWLGQRKRVMRFYLMGAFSVFVVVILIFQLDYLGMVNLSGVPVVTMIVGMFWLLIIKKYFFRGGSNAGLKV